jgi:ectoine hydroxylase-related dioxygenase (phytanoyl-CoA dioxygenase family)
MLYLDESNKNNGALRIIPKSHKITGWINENLTDLTNHPDEITIEVKEGSIILFDGNLWHSGTKNINGKRRRVLYIDFRRKEIPQLLNQRIYLDENTQSKLTTNEKFILGISKDDLIFEDRVHTAGNAYRKQFKTDVFNKQLE